MRELNDNQFFLIITEINLFPELSDSNVEMIEQIMNALLLVHKDNLQAGINKVIEFEMLYNSLRTDNRIEIMKEIQPFLKNHKIFIVQGENVRVFYPLYHKNKNYQDIGKQSAINTEFALEKKINYDGQKITFTDYYLSWVDELINQQRELNSYNQADKLIFHFIEPKVTIKHTETMNIIRQETERYISEVRKMHRKGS